MTLDTLVAIVGLVVVVLCLAGLLCRPAPGGDAPPTEMRWGDW